MLNGADPHDRPLSQTQIARFVPRADKASSRAVTIGITSR